MKIRPEKGRARPEKAVPAAFTGATNWERVACYGLSRQSTKALPLDWTGRDLHAHCSYGKSERGLDLPEAAVRRAEGRVRGTRRPKGAERVAVAGWLL